MDNNGTQIRILLVGGKSIFRGGLRNLLRKEPGFRVVAEAVDGEEAIRLAGELKPDVLLLDFPADNPPGRKVLQRLVKAHADTRVVLLASAEGGDEVAQVFGLGICGVVLRESGSAQLLVGIRSVMIGNRWFGDAVLAPNGKGTRKLPAVSRNAHTPKTFGLTKRELEIVAAVVSGRTNRQIAAKLSISEDTVKHHMTNIFDKAGVYNRLELVLFAIHHGLVGES